jgi:hypothetical protein
LPDGHEHHPHQVAQVGEQVNLIKACQNHFCPFLGFEIFTLPSSSNELQICTLAQIDTKLIPVKFQSHWIPLSTSIHHQTPSAKILWSMIGVPNGFSFSSNFYQSSP